MISQFIFNNLKSFDDFELIISEVTIGNPSVNVISQTVPFMHGQYDFSSIYGGQSYSNRQIKMILFVDHLVDYSRTRLNIMYDKIINWLFQSEMSTLKIDYVEHTFQGRVISISEKQRFIDTESIEVTFDCYPFRISEYEEGHDIWDIFNFELDYAQQTQFNVSVSLSVKIYNPSATKISPVVECSSPMSVTLNNIKYQFLQGISRDHRFKFDIGENNLLIEGNGNIKFAFRKEVI